MGTKGVDGSRLKCNKKRQHPEWCRITFKAGGRESFHRPCFILSFESTRIQPRSALVQHYGGMVRSPWPAFLTVGVAVTEAKWLTGKEKNDARCGPSGKFFDTGGVGPLKRMIPYGFRGPPCRVAPSFSMLARYPVRKAG